MIKLGVQKKYIYIPNIHGFYTIFITLRVLEQFSYCIIAVNTSNVQETQTKKIYIQNNVAS